MCLVHLFCLPHVAISYAFVQTDFIVIMISKRTSTAISDNGEDDLEALQVQLKDSLRKNFPPYKRYKRFDFNVVYDPVTGKRVTSSRRKSCKPKHLPSQNQANRK